ncbi:hypothetical protein J8273_2027 [Carpediemonas membranifera]|uniref:Uncharacterized protein n=1 Tax=Carpediemonas membranifera TaxID=201153 RepID=A0A8J6E414_9EUKA|nr:hypothetical protein J8273_2027 [Carpediemonas membranifera]|eukprot:KAG9396296.1 hypothetical protein J8273_2027 [Carpediemonas membranifera]
MLVEWMKSDSDKRAGREVARKVVKRRDTLPGSMLDGGTVGLEVSKDGKQLMGGKKSKNALIAAYRLSETAARRIPGDIPSLLARAFVIEFHERIPPLTWVQCCRKSLFSNIIGKQQPYSFKDLEKLLSMLSSIPPLDSKAQVLLDRARSIITNGPPLSMNVELAEGEELPVALHTLLQGTLWAILMEAGADPDLQRSDTTASEQNFHYMQQDKLAWFLCKKFFFVKNVSVKDCESRQWSWYDGFCSQRYEHTMYMGRLFMFHSARQTKFTRARMPRIVAVYSDIFTQIAQTPKGLWGWGTNADAETGFLTASDYVNPTRLTFPACPKVAELEASLPPWEKHRMVTDVSVCGRAFILTPVGTVMAGRARFIATVEGPRQFNEVVHPPRFVPDHIMHEYHTVILSMGDRQMIAGKNTCGQLGLGHIQGMTGFVDLPFRIDRIIPSGSFNVFLSGRQLLFAGKVSRTIAQLGLLPGYREDLCFTPTPLQFSERVTGFYCDEWYLVWVTEGRTHMCPNIRHHYAPDYRTRLYCVPFEATALGTSYTGGMDAFDSFCDSTSQWFRVGRVVARVAEMVEGEAPTSSRDIIPVDVEPSRL